MTVGQLIEKLSDLPIDAPVRYIDTCCENTDHLDSEVCEVKLVEDVVLLDFEVVVP